MKGVIRFMVLICIFMCMGIQPAAAAPEETAEEGTAQFIVRKSLYSGVVDTAGNVLLETEWWTVEQARDLWIVSKDFKYGVLNADFTVRHSLRWDAIVSVDGDGAVVKRGGKYGYVNAEDQIVIQPIWEWDSINIMTTEVFGGKRYAIVEKDGLKGIFNENGLIVALEYDHIWPFHDGVAVVVLDGKHGYVDWRGNWIHPVTLDYAMDFYEGLAIVGKDGKYGFMDENGEYVIDIVYSGVVRFDGEWAAVAKNGKVGMINKQGETVIPFEWHAMPQGAFSGDYLQVERNRKVGLIDRNGNVVVEPQYDKMAMTEIEGLWQVQLDGKYGYIYEDGTEFFALAYDDAYMWRELFFMEKDGRYGVFNIDGETVIPIEWQHLDRIYAVEEPTFIAMKDGKYGVIDLGQNVLVDFIYDELGVLTDDENNLLLKMKKDGHYGIVTFQGEEIAFAQWDELWQTPIGYQIIKDGLYGLLSFNGEMIAYPQWDFMEEAHNEGSFSKGFGVIKKDGLSGFVGKDGFVIEPQWFLVTSSNEGMAAVYQDGYFGYINTVGELAVPVQWLAANPFYGGYAIVLGDNGWGVIDKTGNVVVPVEFDEVRPVW